MKGQRSYTFKGYHPNDGLEDGRWVQGRHGVWRWESNQFTVDLHIVPDLPQVEPIIACPTCGAATTETCVTAKGHRTRNHPARTIPRSCACGAVLAWKKRLCDECRVIAKRASMRRTKARQRMGASS